MIFCSCRNISDKQLGKYLAENFSSAAVSDPEAVLESCSGDPANCGKCYSIAEDIVRDHNRRAVTVRDLAEKLPAIKRPVNA